MLDLLDSLVGDRLEKLVAAHHRRRMASLGQGRVLDPTTAGLWVYGYPPPRAGNHVRVLIDGSEVLPTIADALSQARSHVSIQGWSLTPSFQLTRESEIVVLRELLAGLVPRVQARVLLWAGAPVPVFRPWRRQVRRVQRELTEGTSIQCALDSRERPMHTHHQKVVVVDDQVAFVGGVDLTDVPADRFDFPAHPLRKQVGWHDITAQLKGPVVADVAEQFELRWRAITGERLPRPVPQPPAGDHTVQFVITNPENLYAELPRGSFRILEAYIRALRSARQFIYIESQFLWSLEIVAILRDKLLHPPSPDFRMVMVLPVRPDTGGDYTRGQLGVIDQADREGRLLTTTLYAREGPRSQPVYVHAKLAIVDDHWLILGSANLNDHSLFNDTEANIVVRDPDLIRATRHRLWAEHLELPVAAIAGDPVQVIDQIWVPKADEQRQRLDRGLPPTHRLVRLPHLSHRSVRLLGPLQGLIVDG